MLFTKTQRDQLLAPLQAVSGIVERRHTLPILSNVLIEKKGGTLTFLATDIEIQIRTACSVEEGQDAAVTVGAKKLQDILRSLPDCEVALNLDDKKLTVKAGKSRFSLQTLPADDFPRMSPPQGESKKFSLSQSALRKLLGQTQYAMASQDVRYYLNGLLLVVDGNQLKAVATDGHRLAYAAVPIDASLPKHEVIVPRKTVLELNRLLSDIDAPVQLELAGNQARFTFGEVELVSKLIDGKFPDFERVVPPSTKNNLSVGRVTLQQAMQRAAILTNEKFRGVRLVIANDSLKVVAANADQEEALEELEVQYQGDPLDIGFNVGYLLDVLANADAEAVQWGFNDNNSSALVTIPGNELYKYVVMPMRI
jgi:DNA polymerase III subunit beta